MRGLIGNQSFLILFGEHLLSKVSIHKLNAGHHCQTIVFNIVWRAPALQSTIVISPMRGLIATRFVLCCLANTCSPKHNLHKPNAGYHCQTTMFNTAWRTPALHSIIFISPNVGSYWQPIVFNIVWRKLANQSTIVISPVRGIISKQ